MTRTPPVSDLTLPIVDTVSADLVARIIAQWLPDRPLRRGNPIFVLRLRGRPGAGSSMNCEHFLKRLASAGAASGIQKFHFEAIAYAKGNLKIIPQRRKIPAFQKRNAHRYGSGPAAAGKVQT